MKKYIAADTITSSIIPKKQQALDTLNIIKEIYESDTSGLLTGGFYSDFMDEIDTQISQIQRTVS